MIDLKRVKELRKEAPPSSRPQRESQAARRQAGLEEMIERLPYGEWFDLDPLVEELDSEKARLEALSRLRSRPVNLKGLQPVITHLEAVRGGAAPEMTEDEIERQQEQMRLVSDRMDQRLARRGQFVPPNEFARAILDSMAHPESE